MTIEIEIRTVLQLDDHSFMVGFASDFGGGIGAWVSKVAPALGAADVEFALVGAVKETSCSTANEAESPFVSAEEGRVVVCGTLELVDNGVAFLRLGQFLVELGEIDGDLPEEGSFGCYQADRLKLYPTNI